MRTKLNIYVINPINLDHMLEVRLIVWVNTDYLKSRLYQVEAMVSYYLSQALADYEKSATVVYTVNDEETYEKIWYKNKLIKS